MIGWPRASFCALAGTSRWERCNSSTMFETVCAVSAVMRAIAARDNGPLVRIASITTRLLCDLACSRLVPEIAFMVSFIGVEYHLCHKTIMWERAEVCSLFN